MASSVLATHLQFAFALFGVSVFLAYLILKLGILDKPNHRSSHSRPTPSIGGISIVGTFAVGLCVIWVISDDARLSTPYMLSFSVAVAIIALVGLIDDIGYFRSFVFKLGAQVIAALVLVLFGIVLERLSFPLIGQIELGWWGYLVTIVWIVGLTNIFNFMDGLNGLAGGTAVIAAAFLCTITYTEGSFFVYIVCYVIAAGASGFLIFNFPRARLFMGDVGSQFVGFTFAALAIIASEIDMSRTSFLIVPMLFFNFIFDTVFTFCRRAFRRENVTEAHRGHLYQLLNQLGWSHVRVSCLHFVMTTIQGGAALLLIGNGSMDPAMFFMPLLILYSVYAYVVVSIAGRRGLLTK